MSASSLYDPDPRALLSQAPWGNAFLGQRDVALLVPINYHAGPIASLRAACFAHNQYEDTPFIKCVSNLLAAGFRRIVVDVYWDSVRSVWSLCPVKLPLFDVAQGSTRPSSVITASPRFAEARSPGLTDPIVAEDTGTLLSTEKEVKIRVRQDESERVTVSHSSASEGLSSTSNPSDASETSAIPSSTNESAPGNSASSPNYANQVFLIGNYTCTQTMDLRLLTGLLKDYLEGSDVTTDATMTYLILNIHAAASFNAPEAPAEQPSPDRMPAAQDLISNVMNGNLSQKIYTPHKLQDDRNNLNNSWLEVQWDNIPARGYYRVSKNEKDELVTQDGWPTEAYMEFSKFHRLIAGFGSIDPQMAAYDITIDRDTIFGQDEIRSLHNTTFSSSGALTRGCLLSTSDPSITTTTNSSWAISLAPPLNLGPDPNTTTPIPAITNLTSCGFSPFLNTTLSNQTADQNPIPYLAFSHSTLWSWAPGEPTNLTSSPNNCAAISASPPYPGRWQTVDCTTPRRVACHNTNSPYNWTLSASPVAYFSGDTACPESLTFSVPHTALENAHLLSALQSSDSKTEPVYLNFNALDTPGCWTTNINGTCPYHPRQDLNRMRVVVVPTVAAVIIFVLAALTFFVKCAANRREGRRGKRRRNVGGWEYEGIPS